VQCTSDLARLALETYPKFENAREALHNDWFVQAYGLEILKVKTCKAL